MAYTKGLAASLRKAYNDAIHKVFTEVYSEKSYQIIKINNNCFDLLEHSFGLFDDVIVAQNVTANELRVILKLLPEGSRVTPVGDDLYKKGK